MKKCIQKYGKPRHECRTPARWYYRNPQTKELEGPYCGRHARQFRPEALRSIEAYPAPDDTPTGTIGPSTGSACPEFIEGDVP